MLSEEIVLTNLREWMEELFEIEPAEAYGEYKEQLRQKVPRSELGNLPDLKKGMVLMMQTPDRHKMPVNIAEVDAGTVTLDLNH